MKIPMNLWSLEKCIRSENIALFSGCIGNESLSGSDSQDNLNNNSKPGLNRVRLS